MGRRQRRRFLHEYAAGADTAAAAALQAISKQPDSQEAADGEAAQEPHKQSVIQQSLVHSLLSRESSAQKIYGDFQPIRQNENSGYNRHRHHEAKIGVN